MDIVDKSGAWFAYNGEKIGQGRENAKEYLAKNPEVMKEIEQKVRDNFNAAFEKSMGEIKEIDEIEQTEEIE